MGKGNRRVKKLVPDFQLEQGDSREEAAAGQESNTQHINSSK